MRFKDYLDKFPYFFTRSVDSVFYKSNLAVYNELKNLKDDIFLNRFNFCFNTPILIWKMQEEPYEAVYNISCECTGLNHVTVFLGEKYGVPIIDTPVSGDSYKTSIPVDMSIDSYNPCVSVPCTVIIRTNDEVCFIKSFPENTKYSEVFSDRVDFKDSFNHDVKLDIIGDWLNIPRWDLKPPIRTEEIETEEWLKLNHDTYPSFNDQDSEDDYHYRERLQKYTQYMYMETPQKAKVNKVPLPLMRLFQHTNNTNINIINASDYISHMGADVMESDPSLISLNVTCDKTRAKTGEIIRFTIHNTFKEGCYVLTVDDEYYTHVGFESEEKIIALDYHVKEKIHEEGIKHEYHHNITVFYIVDNKESLTDFKDNGADYGYMHSETFNIKTYSEYYADYYIDYQHGNDDNTGTTVDNALRTLDYCINNCIINVEEPIIGLISSVLFSVQVNIHDNVRIFGYGIYNPEKQGFSPGKNTILRTNPEGNKEENIFKLDYHAHLEIKDCYILKEEGYHDCYENPINKYNDNGTHMPLIVCDNEKESLKNYTLYVDNVYGDDNNIGFHKDKPYKTIGRALRDNISDISIIILSQNNRIGNADGKHSNLIIYENTTIQSGYKEDKDIKKIRLQNSILHLHKGKTLNTENILLVDNEGVIVQNLNNAEFINHNDSIIQIRGLHQIILEEVYVDNLNGDDDNTGKSPEQAFKTLSCALTYLKGAGSTVNIISETVDETNDNDTVVNYYVGTNTIIKGLGKYNPKTKKYEEKDNKIINCHIILSDEHTLDMEHIKLVNKEDKIIQSFDDNPTKYHNNNTHGDTIYLDGVDNHISGKKIVTLAATCEERRVIQPNPVIINISATSNGKGVDGLNLSIILKKKSGEQIRKDSEETKNGGKAQIPYNLGVGDYIVEITSEETETYTSSKATTSFNVRESEYDYYVDSVHGHDNNTGKTPDKAFKTLEKALKQDVDDKIIALINEKTTK